MTAKSPKSETPAVSQLRGEISALSTRLREMDAATEKHIHDLATLTAALVAKETTLEAQASQIVRLNQQITALQHQIKQGQTRHEAELSQAHNSAAHFGSEVDAMRKSTSWKVTAPLRLAGKIKGGK